MPCRNFSLPLTKVNLMTSGLTALIKQRKVDELTRHVNVAPIDELLVDRGYDAQGGNCA